MSKVSDQAWEWTRKATEDLRRIGTAANRAAKAPQASLAEKVALRRIERQALEGAATVARVFGESVSARDHLPTLPGGANRYHVIVDGAPRSEEFRHVALAVRAAEKLRSRPAYRGSTFRVEEWQYKDADRTIDTLIRKKVVWTPRSGEIGLPREARDPSSAHQAGFYFGLGGPVGLIWQTAKREIMRTPRGSAERAAFARGLAAGRAARTPTRAGRDPRSAPRASDRVRLEWEDGEVTTSTIGSFFRENSMPAEDRDELLRKGRLDMGGGAAPRVRVVLVRGRKGRGGRR